MSKDGNRNYSAEQICKVQKEDPENPGIAQDETDTDEEKSIEWPSALCIDVSNGVRE
jgi:hypothetical protein